MLRKCLVAILMIISLGLYAQDVDRIMQHYFDTVSGGNIGNWKKIKTAYIESISYYNEPNSVIPSTPTPSLINSPTKYRRTFRLWPDKLKLELYSDSTYTDLLSLNLWLPDKLILSFAHYDPIVKPSKGPSWDFTPVYIHKLLTNAKSKKYKGVREFDSDSISCYVIEIVTDDVNLDLFINSSTYLLEYSKVFNPSDSANFVRYYDYRLINGFLIETRNFAMRNGVITQADRRTKIILNAKIDDDEFDFP